MRRGGLLTDTRGATAVEFALLSPLFFGLLLMIIQTATGFLVGQLLERAADDLERTLQTAPAAGRVVSDQAAVDLVCSQLLGLVPCDQLQLTIVNRPDIAATCVLPPCPVVVDPYGRGNVSDLIRIQMGYLWPGVFRLADLSALFSVRSNQYFHVVRFVRKEKPA